MRETIRVVRPDEAAVRITHAVSALAQAPLQLDAASLPDVLALLACGRFDRVRPLLRDPAPSAVLPLVLARYVAWTGDLQAAAAAWPAVRASLDSHAAPGDDLHAVLAAAGLSALERTATDLGDPQLAASLIGRARAARSLLETRALDRDAATLAGLLSPDTHPTTGDTPAAAILGFCRRALGLEPDATRHRLRLRPRLSPDQPVLQVNAISFGDATISLACHLETGRLRCEVEQDSGAIPVTALLEPVLPAPFVAAEVDAQPANLSPLAVSPDTVLPVQLVLDHRRTLLISLAPNE